MKTVAILLADGFEEGEALFVVDILRRAGMQVDIVSTMDRLQVTGSHNITAIADCLLDKQIETYDMIVLPGGLPGATNLRDNKQVIALVQSFNQQQKYIAAICAAPIVLQEAGVVKGKQITSYPGEKYESIFKDSIYKEDIVVVDGHIITSRGPATTLPFAYTLVDILGGNSEVLKQGMLYDIVSSK